MKEKNRMRDDFSKLPDIHQTEGEIERSPYVNRVITWDGIDDISDGLGLSR